METVHKVGSRFLLYCFYFIFILFYLFFLHLNCKIYKHKHMFSGITGTLTPLCGGFIYVSYSNSALRRRAHCLIIQHKKKSRQPNQNND